MPIIRNKAAEEEKQEACRLKGGYTIPIIALALSVCLGAQFSLLSWQVTGALLIVGLILYALAANRLEHWEKGQSTE